MKTKKTELPKPTLPKWMFLQIDFEDEEAVTLFIRKLDSYFIENQNLFGIDYE